MGTTGLVNSYLPNTHGVQQLTVFFNIYLILNLRTLWVMSSGFFVRSVNFFFWGGEGAGVE